MIMFKNAKTILWVYTLAFVVSTSTHVYDAFMTGWPASYSGIPDWMNIFFSALLLIDPLIILLLWTKRTIGVILALAFMISDMGLNTYISFGMNSSGADTYLVMQILFVIYALFTARPLTKGNA